MEKMWFAKGCGKIYLRIVSHHKKQSKKIKLPESWHASQAFLEVWMRWCFRSQTCFRTVSWTVALQFSAYARKLQWHVVGLRRYPTVLLALAWDSMLQCIAFWLLYVAVYSRIGPYAAVYSRIQLACNREPMWNSFWTYVHAFRHCACLLNLCVSICMRLGTIFQVCIRHSAYRSISAKMFQGAYRTIFGAAWTMLLMFFLVCTSC